MFRRRNEGQSAIMEARCLLLLIFAIQGGSSDDQKGPYCTEQRGTIIVEYGQSVTIPCSFTYSKQKDKSLAVRVYWRRSGSDRCGAGDFIYNHTEGQTHSDYRGRISLVGNPEEEGTATITISDLRRTDRPMFCCRIHLYEASKIIEQWQSRHGTFIQFKDEFSVEQTDVVPAFIGEDITIPCVVHHIDSSIIEEVTWTVGSSDLCVENKEKSVTWTEKSQVTERWSVVNFPVDLSLKITGVTSEDNKQYCCKVKRRRQRERNTVSSIHGTEVVVVDTSNNPDFEVVQQDVVSPDSDGSATINCSFTLRSDIEPLWMGVFWRVGSPRGYYAYHPFMEMVHPSYRGRTELRGLADLHIKEFNDTDDTTYHCFVMLKFCVGNNIIKSTIRYESGTKLKVKESTWPYILVAVVFIAIILCALVIFISKKRGVICQKSSRREDNKYLTSEIALKEQNSSTNVQMPRASSSSHPPPQEDSGGILYAHLNVTSLQQKTSSRSTESKPDSDSQVVYAAVKSPTAHQ